MIKDVVVKVSTFEGFNGGGWRLEHLEIGTVQVEGKAPQTRLNKVANWCADMTTKDQYSYRVYEVVGEKSSSESTNGIYGLKGFYDTL
ncbi:hypothetical protein NVP1193O_047 [Vibrio phage 1.193.O._10N.286.52.C6]|nr:hypothetical protein NVP1193O_047 [Vibrio phage 1.193.O._10N.286.52.C6]